MANENDKKTPSDAQASKGPRTAVVTWFAVHEALMNPGMQHITSYMAGNTNMHGNRKFFWIVGSHYISSQTEKGETCIVPIVNLKSFSVKL
jgi:hypothetical protein